MATSTELIERAGLNDHGLDVRLSRICAAAVSITHADQAEVNINNHHNQQFVGLWPEPRLNGPVATSGTSACTFVVSNDQMLVLDDVRIHSHTGVQSWAGVVVESYIGIPVHYQGVAVASLCCYTIHTKHHWTEPEILVMRGFANMVEACFPLPPELTLF
jgi:GAF domain-containing protein